MLRNPTTEATFSAISHHINAPSRKISRIKYFNVLKTLNFTVPINGLWRMEGVLHFAVLNPLFFLKIHTKFSLNFSSGDWEDLSLYQPSKRVINIISDIAKCWHEWSIINKPEGKNGGKSVYNRLFEGVTWLYSHFFSGGGRARSWGAGVVRALYNTGKNCG